MEAVDLSLSSSAAKITVPEISMLFLRDTNYVQNLLAQVCV